jgi:acetyl-CoA carboxylase carboxyltransferase component
VRRLATKSTAPAPAAASAAAIPQTFVPRLLELKKQAIAGGGAERVAQQHAKGKLTARERIDLLVDKDSFVEYDQLVEHRCTDFGMEKQKVCSQRYSANQPLLQLVIHISTLCGVWCGGVVRSTLVMAW